LIETLKDLGENMELDVHCEILVRKTGELFVRRKRGRRKQVINENSNKVTPRGNNAYEETNSVRQSSISTVSDDDDTHQ
jgi:hypothetical protein